MNFKKHNNPGDQFHCDVFDIIDKHVLDTF